MHSIIESLIYSPTYRSSEVVSDLDFLIYPDLFPWGKEIDLAPPITIPEDNPMLFADSD